MQHRVIGSLVFLSFIVAGQFAIRAQTAPGIITSVPGTEGCSELTADPAGNFYFMGEQGFRKMAAGTTRITPVTVPFAIAGSPAVDAAGDIYFPSFNQIEKIAAANGAVTEVAGTKDKDNGTARRIPGPATQAFLRHPTTLALDAASNLYIGEASDTTNDVLKLDAATGVISGMRFDLYAALGVTRGNPGTPIPGMTRPVVPAALLADPEGNLYIADRNHSVVWKSGAGTGTFTRVAGSGAQGYNGDNLPATQANLDGPSGLALDLAGNLYIADNARVRMVSKADGIITTVAGNGTTRNQYASVPGPDGNLTQRYQKADDGDGGPATRARVSETGRIAFDHSGNLYICGGIMRKVSGAGKTSASESLSATPASAGPATAAAPGTITTVAGNGTSKLAGDGVSATATGMRHPVSVSVDPAGNLFIADDFVDYSVLKVAAGTGILSRVAGTGKAPVNTVSGDGGPATAANLFGAVAAVPDAGGNLYIADNGAVRKVAAAGNISSIMRAQNSAQNRFGYAPDAVPLSRLDPDALATDGAGNLYIGDRYLPCVRKFGTDRTVTVAAGTCDLAAGGYTGDGGPAASAKVAPVLALAVDTAGNLYLAGGNRVRKVTAATGIITTIAGNGNPGFEGDGTAALNARFNNAEGIAVDSAGDVFVADHDNHRVRKIAARTGIITTVVGTGRGNYGGDGGPAAEAALNGPTGLAFDSAGNLYIADTDNYRIRKVIAAGK